MRVIMKIDWIIPNTIARFEAWFSDNWRHHHTVEYFSTPTTHVYVTTQTPYFFPNNENITVIHIDGTSAYEKVGEDYATGYDFKDIIVMTMIQLDSDRIELKIECNYPIVEQEILLPFMQEIKALWAITDKEGNYENYPLSNLSHTFEPLQPGMENEIPENFEESKPWEKIPDNGLDRIILESFYNGKLEVEIGKELNYSRVKVRLCELRKEFGVQIVPYAKDIHKRLITQKVVTSSNHM